MEKGLEEKEQTWRKYRSFKFKRHLQILSFLLKSKRVHEWEIFHLAWTKTFSNYTKQKLNKIGILVISKFATENCVNDSLLKKFIFPRLLMKLILMLGGNFGGFSSSTLLKLLYSCCGASPASPSSPAVSDVQRVRLSRSNCMISVESL